MRVVEIKLGDELP